MSQDLSITVSRVTRPAWAKGKLLEVLARQAATPADRGGSRQPDLLPVEVQIAQGRKIFALLRCGPRPSEICLITSSVLLGRKVRVTHHRPDGTAAWDVRILWTMRLFDGVFENGALLLKSETGSR
jgi:hypothetical protein